MPWAFAQPRSASRNTAAAARKGSGVSCCSPLISTLGCCPSLVSGPSTSVTTDSNTSHTLGWEEPPATGSEKRLCTTQTPLASARQSRRPRTPRSRRHAVTSMAPGQFCLFRSPSAISTRVVPHAATAFGKSSLASSRKSPGCVARAARARSTIAQRTSRSFDESEMSSSRRRVRCDAKGVRREAPAWTATSVPAAVPAAVAPAASADPIDGRERKARSSALRGAASPGPEGTGMRMPARLQRAHTAASVLAAHFATAGSAVQTCP
mmetsp:Transcript_33508/g.104396  ORF Transcript_33508/g.104396 Transcript_33508/m.104396 type:complete len:266 (-) Transcript_33508:67-864(-)